MNLFTYFFWRHKDRQNVENDFILSAENSTFAAVFLMDTNGNILEYYRTIQRGHLVGTVPHHQQVSCSPRSSTGNRPYGQSAP